jgi:predicted ATPase
MLIKKIKLKNFKSFKDVEVDLGEFNVLIGPNASGKSNFVQVFQFLRDIVSDGFDNAISMQGGIQFLRNIKIASDNPLLINVIFKTEFVLLGKPKKRTMTGISINEVNYELAIGFKKRGLGYEILKETMIQKFNYFRFDSTRNRLKKKEKLGEGELSFIRKNGKIEPHIEKSDNIDINLEDFFPPYIYEEKLSGNSPFLGRRTRLGFFTQDMLNEIAIYNVDPKLAKKATPIKGKAELEEDGNNLAIVLKSLIEHKLNKKKLFNLVNDLLPFISNMNVEKFADKSLLFTIHETFFGKKSIPASLLSEGTIIITALIIALYFEKKELTIIEEPERNIHPYLISKIVDMMKDASKEKQIIVTTHNPEVLKHAGLENILLISRDKEGFSTISRPNEKEEVKTFLENEIGIDELFIQNLLK